MGTSNFRDEDEDKLGILSRSLLEIFRFRETKKNDWDIKLEISYMEIYNEELRDLLDPNPKTLLIKESPKIGIHCDGLTCKEVKFDHEAFRYLEVGGSNRATSQTLMNETSSRSHAIFTV